jgi:formylglycine-generating enzyme required for sulfatase activity
MDFTGDCFVDLADFAVFVDQWLTGIPKDTVLIPGGTFQMGNSTNAEEGDSDELPVHTVTLDSFAIGKYEVTKGQYCAFLNSAYPSQLKVVNGVVYAFGDSGNSYGYCDTSTSSYYSQISFSNDTFSILTKGGKDMTSHPMIEVSWYGAAAYCNWRSQQEGKPICYDLSTWNCDLTQEGYRLPTEAEWEYAGRGGLSGKRFPWGDTITHSQANYRSYWEEGKPYYPYDVNPTEGYPPTWNDGIVPYTSPVGSFAANGLGLCDMAGNALELCNDWYSDTYYSSSPTNNPKGPTTGNARVIRGGSWYYIAHICRVSKRGNLTPDFRGDYLSFGFRVVLGLN